MIKLLINKIDGYNYYLNDVNSDDSYVINIEFYGDKPAHLNYSFVFSIKNKVEIDSDVKKGYSTLPICNITKAGTWWRSYGEGHLNKSKIIK